MKNSIADTVERISANPTDKGRFQMVEQYEELVRKIDGVEFEKPSYTLPLTDTIGIRASVTCLGCCCQA